MEPLCAFALAAGILQVVDFSSRLLSAGYQLYQDGSTVRNSEFTLVADDLSSLNDKIKAWARPDLSVSGPLAKDNQALENLTVEISKIADELTLILLRVRLKGDATAFKSFRQAVLTMWNKSKIEETVQRLESIRGEVQFRILVSMMEKVNKETVLADPALQSLGDATRVIVESILQNKSDVAAIVAAQTFESIQREDAREAAAIRRHDEVIAKIDHLPCVAGSNISSGYAVGVYWISGKAGSGKSTLMKFIVQDARFMEALSSWAGDVPLIVTSFYFWNPGDAIQKSQEGLLRTIILEALRANPALGSILFPDRYEPGASWIAFPTFHQLRRAFTRLTNQSEIPLKIAFIVDGLDEFEPTDASYTELSDIFLTATRSPNIKAVLSSRPLSAFEASFADTPKLRLHELTKTDIETFVQDKLGCHPRLDELSQDDPVGAKALVSEIVEAASGVFLWVKLVVDSLVEGFQNFDGLEDLSTRLRVIPRDLEDLFQRMLQHIPSEYKAQSSRMFQIIRCHETSQRRRGRQPLTAMGLLFAELCMEKILQAPIAPLTELEERRKHKEIEGRLRSRCAGLFEVRHVVGGQPIKPTVHYLHRSVADWLQKQQVWDKILEGTRDTSFNPFVCCLQSVVMRLKVSQLSLNPDALVLQWGLVEICMTLTKSIEESAGEAQDRILDEMDRIMTVFYEILVNHRVGGNFSPCSNWCESSLEDNRLVHWHDTFLAFTLWHGLFQYVQAKIEDRGGTLPKKRGMPLLGYACLPGGILRGQQDAAHVDMARYLLNHGADPNEQFNGFSPWQNVVLKPIKDHACWISTLELLVQHGADPHAYVEELLNDNRPGVSHVDDTWRVVYHHRRKSVFTILKEYADSREYEDVREELLGLAKTLEEKGAKAEEYWVEPPDAPPVAAPKGKETIFPLGLRTNLIEKILTPTKEQEGSREKKDKPTRRARRYLERFFKPSS
ncbi:hypothetical protein P154DRAFT_559504 [Amniculicola lignicola CBS 123094]|uniref:Uncharacterized protein n=1 Tax=Amniculicola lignicola CBS 123094 TaxID=1392246 RepID=A0A6A5WVG1_9PLEO|nr:hypothetical protein P154DRAFT_559504 [Amniculicola lignicola CBS 123094]